MDLTLFSETKIENSTKEKNKRNMHVNTNMECEIPTLAARVVLGNHTLEYFPMFILFIFRSTIDHRFSNFLSSSTMGSTPVQNKP
jgi:hypothetical protein